MSRAQVAIANGMLAHSGGAAGDPIYIRTHDDIAVAGVCVSIADGAGVGLEDGQAVADAIGTRRVYTAQASVETGTAVRITVTPSDRPGGDGVCADR